MWYLWQINLADHCCPGTVCFPSALAAHIIEINLFGTSAIYGVVLVSAKVRYTNCCESFCWKLLTLLQLMLTQQIVLHLLSVGWVVRVGKRIELCTCCMYTTYRWKYSRARLTATYLRADVTPYWPHKRRQCVAIIKLNFFLSSKLPDCSNGKTKLRDTEHVDHCKHCCNKSLETLHIKKVGYRKFNLTNKSAVQ